MMHLVDVQLLHPDVEEGISRSCFWHLIGLQLSISEMKNKINVRSDLTGYATTFKRP